MKKIIPVPPLLLWLLLWHKEIVESFIKKWASYW